MLTVYELLDISKIIDIMRCPITVGEDKCKKKMTVILSKYLV